MKDRPFQLTDIVRETSYAIHRYHVVWNAEMPRPRYFAPMA